MWSYELAALSAFVLSRLRSTLNLPYMLRKLWIRICCDWINYRALFKWVYTRNFLMENVLTEPTFSLLGMAIWHGIVS